MTEAYGEIWKQFALSFDEIDPTATPRSIASTNAKTFVAKTGDDVVITFTVSETLLNDPTVTIDGNPTVISNALAPIYQATYTTVGGETEGILAYTLDFTDRAGNSNTTYTSVTDGTSVTYDETAPQSNTNCR